LTTKRGDLAIRRRSTAGRPIDRLPESSGVLERAAVIGRRSGRRAWVAPR
jgi:hypothetical protein